MNINFLEIKSEEELKKHGSLKEIRYEFNSIIGNKDNNFKTNTWRNMYNSVLIIQSLSKSILNCSNNDDLYFKGEAEKYIFYLLELQGEERLRKLGINKLHFVDMETATKWKKNIAKIVHPDSCSHIKAKDAMEVVSKLYGEMSKR